MHSGDKSLLLCKISPVITTNNGVLLIFAILGFAILGFAILAFAILGQVAILGFAILGFAISYSIFSHLK